MDFSLHYCLNMLKNVSNIDQLSILPLLISSSVNFIVYCVTDDLTIYNH